MEMKAISMKATGIECRMRIIRAILCPCRRPDSIGIGADPAHTRTQISAERLARRRCDNAMSHADAETHPALRTLQYEIAADAVLLANAVRAEADDLLWEFDEE